MQITKLKEIILRQHKNVYHPITSKKARGYRKAALGEMHSFYQAGTADYTRILALLSNDQQVSGFITTHMPGGSKGSCSRFISFSSLALLFSYLALVYLYLIVFYFILFAEFAHVKELDEAQQKQADEAAAKQQEENGLGIEAPLRGATIEDVSKWIAKFKENYFEVTDGKSTRFKVEFPKDLASKLKNRIDQWISQHPSQTSKYRNFEADLRVAFNEAQMFN